MRVFLDDDPIYRPTPDGWIRARWPDEVIAHLETGRVTHLSLDHDLGDAEDAQRAGRPERTGYTVAVWLEEAVYTRDFVPPVVTIHSANPEGRRNIMGALHSIARFLARPGISSTRDSR